MEFDGEISLLAVSAIIESIIEKSREVLSATKIQTFSIKTERSHSKPRNVFQRTENFTFVSVLIEIMQRVLSPCRETKTSFEYK
jgi:hypothetical protein